MERILIGKPVVAGSAKGVALVCREPLSLWGGLNPRTGEIIDRRHALSGEMAAGRVLVLPQGKGSSTGSAILLESVRSGVAPAAIINLKADPIIALGSIVADELYNKPVPIVVLPEEAFYSINKGDQLTIEPDGTVRVNAEPSTKNT